MMDGSEEHPIVYFDDKGNGPNFHVCEERETPAIAVAEWLDSQKLIGLDAASIATVERLIKDLR